MRSIGSSSSDWSETDRFMTSMSERCAFDDDDLFHTCLLVIWQRVYILGPRTNLIWRMVMAKAKKKAKKKAAKKK